MKTKILCLIIIATVFCSLFVISVSADDNISPLAEYDAPTDLTGTTWLINGSVSTLSRSYVFNVTGSFLSINSAQSPTQYTFNRVAVNDSSQYYSFSVGTGTTYPQAFNAFIRDSSSWIQVFYQSVTTSFSIRSDDESYRTLTFTGGTDSTNTLLISWLMENAIWLDAPEPEPVIVPLSSGYYRLNLPVDIEQPTWIGDRNTVWYDMYGRVVTEDSIRAISFQRLGISYFVNEGPDYGLGVWGIEIRVDTYTDTNLEVLQITYDGNNNQFYWSYNDLILDSFVGIALDGDYEVTDDFKALFDDLFEPYDYVYTGNPWYDIVDGVIDALKIDVFGDFSPWDILVTFIGISVFIWLLKLLAGG